MKADLFQLCDDKWPEVRKFLSSDAVEEEKKSNIMYSNGYGWTCLHRVCRRAALDDIIEAMLDIGGKELVMKKALYGNTALHYACNHGASYNIIKMLIEVGGKDLVMAKDDNGDTALHLVCWYIKAHTKVAEKVKLILEVGDANLLLSTKNFNGKTPLEIAADKGASKKIKKLLTIQSNSTTNNDSPSTNIVPADNSTPITQSSQEINTTPRSSSNNDLNIPIRGLDIDQNHQIQLREAKEKAQTIQLDFDQKCIDYSDLEENSQSQLKDAKGETKQIQQDYDQKCAELQLLIDSRNGEGTKRKYSVEEHQEEEGSVVLSQSQSQSSKRSRLERTAETALVASGRKQPEDGRLEMITCQLLNEKEQHSKLIQQLLDAWKELKDVKARNVQLEEDAKLD
jgi:ankyrin repeat protein